MKPFTTACKKISLSILIGVLVITSTPTNAYAALSEATKARLDEVASGLSSTSDLTDIIMYLYTMIASGNTDIEVGSGVDTTSTNSSNAALCSYAKLLTKNLSRGMTDPQVRTLQQLLNNLANDDSAYSPVAEQGEGSHGLETSYYGTATYAAVSRWQQRNMSYREFGSLDAPTREKMKEVYCAVASDTDSGTETNNDTNAGEEEFEGVDMTVDADVDITRSTTDDVKILAIDEVAADGKVRFVIKYWSKGASVLSRTSPVLFSRTKTGFGSNHLAIGTEDVEAEVTTRELYDGGAPGTVVIKTVEFDEDDIERASNAEYYSIAVANIQGKGQYTEVKALDLDTFADEESDSMSADRASASTIALTTNTTNLRTRANVELTYKAPFRACRLWKYTSVGTEDVTSTILSAIRDQGLTGTVDVDVNRPTKFQLTCNGDSSDRNPTQTAELIVKFNGENYNDPNDLSDGESKVSGTYPVLMAQTSNLKSDYVFFEGDWEGSEVNGVAVRYDTRPGDCSQLRYELNNSSVTKQSLVKENSRYHYLYFADTDEAAWAGTFYYCYVGLRNGAFKYETASSVGSFTVNGLKESQLKLDVALQTGDGGPVTVVYDATGNSGCYIAGQRPGVSGNYFRIAVTGYGTKNQTYFRGSTYTLTCDGGYKRTVTENQINR